MEKQTGIPDRRVPLHSVQIVTLGQYKTGNGTNTRLTEEDKRDAYRL